MKILDVPQTGKLGLTVTFPSRNGLIRRAKVTPANPRTFSQLAVRSAFTASASAYDALTTAQQDAWSTAAANYQSRPTLGQSGPLTGFQLFQKLNAILRQMGQDPITEPSLRPQFAANVPQNLTITNTGGLIALKLTCPTTPGTNTVVRASAPQRSGVRRLPSLRILGMCPTPAQGSADITSLYTVKFGQPQPGQRIFVTVNQMTDGWQSAETSFSALVPASA